MGSPISRQNRNDVSVHYKILFLLICAMLNCLILKSIQRGVLLENIEGDIAFDKPDLPTAPLLPDEENDFLEQTQIAFKEVI